MKCPADVYQASTRPYQGLPDIDYPFHDRTIKLTSQMSSEDSSARTAGKPVRPKSVTYVAGTMCLELFLTNSCQECHNLSFLLGDSGKALTETSRSVLPECRPTYRLRMPALQPASPEPAGSGLRRRQRRRQPRPAVPRERSHSEMLEPP
jgi:hypothetical protein